MTHKVDKEPGVTETPDNSAMPGNALNVYAIGREATPLRSPFQAKDAAVGSTRLDGLEIKDARFRHCTFANVSFKESTIQNGEFMDCVFVRCYFRRATLNNSQFIGCQFTDCHFGKVTIRSTQFTHSTFERCQIPFDELHYNLPPEPNLREELARRLFLESTRLGLASEARKYRVAEMEAREANLRAAVAGRSQWYREHFDGLARWRAAAQLVLSLLNRYLWGYGQQAWTLFRNVVVLSLLAFPLFFYIVRTELSGPNGEAVGFSEILYFSLDNMIPSDIGSETMAAGLVARLLAGTESAFGLLALALFASHMFRWSLHR